jgi:hypothetical protein
MHSFLVAAEESEHQLRDIGIDPYGVGAITLVIVILLILGLLAFGKGREHS